MENYVSPNFMIFLPVNIGKIDYSLSVLYFHLKKFEMLGVLLFMHSKNTIQLAIIFLIYTILCKQGRNFLWNVALLI